MNIYTTWTTSSDKIDVSDVNYFGLVVTKLFYVTTDATLLPVGFHLSKSCSVKIWQS